MKKPVKAGYGKK